MSEEPADYILKDSAVWTLIFRLLGNWMALSLVHAWNYAGSLGKETCVTNLCCIFLDAWPQVRIGGTWAVGLEADSGAAPVTKRAALVPWGTAVPAVMVMLLE